MEFTRYSVIIVLPIHFSHFLGYEDMRCVMEARESWMPCFFVLIPIIM